MYLFAHMLQSSSKSLPFHHKKTNKRSVDKSSKLGAENCGNVRAGRSQPEQHVGHSSHSTTSLTSHGVKSPLSTFKSSAKDLARRRVRRVEVHVVIQAVDDARVAAPEAVGERIQRLRRILLSDPRQSPRILSGESASR